MAKKQVTNPQAQAATRKQRQKQFRAGTHPQQWWRVKDIRGARKKILGTGANLGPMGELGDEIIIQLKLSFGYNLVEKVLPDLSRDKVWKLIQENVYVPLAVELDKKIFKWVPVMSGALSDSIRKSMTPDSSIITKEAFLQTNMFEVVLNTKGIPYGKPVNKMPKRYTVHPASHHPNRRNGYSLYDPSAEPGFFNLLVVHGRNYAKALFIAFMRNNFVPVIKKALAGITALKTMLGLNINANPYNIAQSLIEVRYK